LKVVRNLDVMSRYALEPDFAPQFFKEEREVLRKTLEVRASLFVHFLKPRFIAEYAFGVIVLFDFERLVLAFLRALMFA